MGLRLNNKSADAERKSSPFDSQQQKSTDVRIGGELQIPTVEDSHESSRTNQSVVQRISKFH